MRTAKTIHADIAEALQSTLHNLRHFPRKVTFGAMAGGTYPIAIILDDFSKCEMSLPAETMELLRSIPKRFYARSVKNAAAACVLSMMCASHQPDVGRAKAEEWIRKFD